MISLSITLELSVYVLTQNKCGHSWRQNRFKYKTTDDTVARMFHSYLICREALREIDEMELRDSGNICGATAAITSLIV